MIQLLQCEYRKTRRRYILLTAFAITAIQLVWALGGELTDFIVQNGWMMFLYQLPLVNTIFCPLLSAVVASRLCDMEHKGNMYKHLLAFQEKGRLYDAKFLFGLAIVMLCVLTNWSIIIIFGYVVGFAGDVPVGLYLLYLLFTVAPTAAVYIFQHSLSMIFKNQAIPFIAGIMGAFIGMFSMFLQGFPFLRRIFIWGYYGTLQFVWMFGWTKETRFENAYYEVMDIDWLFFCILIIVSIIMYFTGRKIFCRKEV